MNFGQGHCFYLLRGQYFYFQFWCREFGYVWELEYAESVAGHWGHGSQLPRFLRTGRVLSAEERLGASHHAGSHPHQRHGTGRSRLHLLILTCLSTCTLSPVREMWCIVTSGWLGIKINSSWSSNHVSSSFIDLWDLASVLTQGCHNIQPQALCGKCIKSTSAFVLLQNNYMI